MAEQKSRLVLEIDSRDAEQKAADVRKALGALEDAGIRVKPAMDKAGAGIDGVGKTASKAGESLGQLGKSADGSAKSTASSSESYAEASTRLLAMATNSLQASDYVKALSASTSAASVSFDAASDKVRSLSSLAARLRAESDALVGSTDKTAASTRNASVATDLQAKELAELLGKISPAVAALGRLDDMQSKLGQFHKAGLLDTETFKDYSTRLDSTRKGLSAFDEGLSKTGISAKQTEAALRQLPMQFTDIFTSLAAGQNPLLVLLQQGGQIKDSFGGVNNTLDVLKTKIFSVFSGGAEVASLGSSLSGVAETSKDVAKSAGAAGDGLSDLAESSNTAAEAAENAQKAASALNEVVARSPTNYLAAIAGLTPFAVSVGVLGAAALQGIKDVNEFNKALVSTGGFAGKTAAQLIDLTTQLANGENFNDARDAILALVKSGRLTGDTFDAVAAAATEMAVATGDSAADIVSKFQGARGDVTGLAADLSSSNHSVTASVYEQVAALQKQGESMEALRILSVSVAGEMKRRNDEISESTRGIAKLWDDATSALGRYWNQLKSGVAADKDSFRLQVLRQQVEDISGGSWFSNKARDSLKKQYADEIAQIEMRLKAKDEERKFVQEALDNNDKYIASSKKLNDQLDNASPAKKRAAAIRALNSEYLGLLASAERLGKSSSLLEGVSYDGKSFSGGSYDQLLKTINDSSKDPKTPKGKSYTEDAGQKMLDQARQQFAVLQQQNSLIGLQKGEVDKLGASGQTLIKWEQELADIKGKKTLTADQKSLIANQDLITAQLKRNAGLERENELRKTAAEEVAKLSAFQANQDSRLATAQDGLDANIAGIGLGDKARARLKEDLAIQKDYARQSAALLEQFNTKRISPDLYAKENAIVQEGLAKRLLMQQDNYNQQDAAQNNWLAGASSAWQNYFDIATDYNQQTQDATAQMLGSTTTSISAQIQGMIKGTTSLGDAFINLGSTMGSSVLQALSDIAAKWVVVHTLKMAGIGAETTETVASEGIKAAAKVSGDAIATGSTLASLATTVAANVSAAATTIASWLPAALVASIGSFGAAAVVGGTALIAAYALIKGFSSGGYTGAGGVNEPAGMVHKGEVVWSQSDISRFGGVAAVESLRKGNVTPFGAARSGAVGTYASKASAVSASTSLTVNLIENPNKSGQVERGRNSDGTESLSLFVAQIRSGGNETSDAFESTYNLKRHAG